MLLAAKIDGFRPPPLGDGIMGNSWNTAQMQMNGPPSSGPAPWSNAPSKFEVAASSSIPSDGQFRTRLADQQQCIWTDGWSTET